MLYEQCMWVRGFTKIGTYQGIVKATGSGVLEDLTFKISEFQILQNCSLHNTLIP